MKFFLKRTDVGGNLSTQLLNFLYRFNKQDNILERNRHIDQGQRINNPEKDPKVCRTDFLQKCRSK